MKHWLQSAFIKFKCSYRFGHLHVQLYMYMFFIHVCTFVSSFKITTYMFQFEIQPHVVRGPSCLAYTQILTTTVVLSFKDFHQTRKGGKLPDCKWCICLCTNMGLYFKLKHVSSNFETRYKCTYMYEKHIHVQLGCQTTRPADNSDHKRGQVGP